MKNQMLTLLAAGAFVVGGAVTAQAADITPVTGHWTCGAGEASARIVLSNAGNHLHIAKSAAAALAH